MRIEWAIACRQYVDTEDGPNMFGVGVDTAPVDGDGPWVVPVYLAYCLVSDYRELVAQQSFRIDYAVLGPDLLPQREGEGESLVLLPPDDEHYEGWEGRYVRVALLAIEASDEGAYSLEVRIEGQPPLTVPYYVRRAGIGT